MQSRVTIAKENHKKGYNCCQAVVCAYSDLLGMDEKTAFRAAEAFGSGIAMRQETCGSVCGMEMLAGLKSSDGNLEHPASKVTTYKLGNQMAKKFEEWNTTCNCAELKGIKGSGKIRSCRGCVADCARIVEDFLFPGEFDSYEERKEAE